MRRKEKQLLDQQIINEMLNSAEICHISILDEDAPYTIAVNYAYEDRKIYIHSAKKGRKIELLQKHPKVCFNVVGYHSVASAEKACDWTAKYRSIIGYGNVSVVLDDEEITRKGLDLIMKKYGAEGKQEYGKHAVMATAMLVLDIDKMDAKQSGDWE